MWLFVAAYSAHALEEFMFDGQNWARQVLRLPAQWGDFYITNTVVIVIGVVAAKIAPVWPAVALGFAAPMLINATFFHLGPVVWMRGRFSPGLITALLIFYPLGIETIWLSQPNMSTVIVAFAVGALLMATPIIFLKLKTLPYFDQERVSAR